MSHHDTCKLCLAIGVLAATLAGSGSLSYGVTGCQPQTPCPCAADGVCRPNRETWGHYKTRWRTWPGEISGDKPTVADAPTTEAETLPPFETPIPEQEDLRGPPKEKPSKDEEPAAEAEGDMPAQLLPGPEALPAIDPQGNNQHQLPQLEDAPPELPESLRQAAIMLNQPPAGQVQLAPSQPHVQQVSWQPPAAGLINPASAVVVEQAGNTLQQAIYYEASEQSDQSEVAAE